MIKVFIDGQAGTTGLRIKDRLLKREDIELLIIDEDKRKDTNEIKKFINVHKSSRIFLRFIHRTLTTPSGIWRIMIPYSEELDRTFS